MLRKYAFCPVLILVMLSVTYASADLERCAAIKQDAERLACYDAIANESETRRTQDAGQDERSLVIARCRAQMGEYGSRMESYASIKTWQPMRHCRHIPMTSVLSLNAALGRWGNTVGEWSSYALTKTLRLSEL